MGGCCTGRIQLWPPHPLHRGFVAELRTMCVTPHVAAKAKASAIDARTTRHAGYAVSQRKRKQVEEPFGWAKTIGQIWSPLISPSCPGCSLPEPQAHQFNTPRFKTAAQEQTVPTQTVLQQPASGCVRPGATTPRSM